MRNHHIPCSKRDRTAIQRCNSSSFSAPSTWSIPFTTARSGAQLDTQSGAQLATIRGTTSLFDCAWGQSDTPTGATTGTHQLELGVLGGALLIHAHTVRHALAFLFRWLCGQLAFLDLDEALWDFGVCRKRYHRRRRLRTAFVCTSR